MQSKPFERHILLLTAVCFFAFFIFGFTDNLKGPTLPVMLSELNFNYGIGGNILFGLYLGFLIATLITGILADRFGLKVVLLLAGICLALGVGGYSTFTSASLLGVSLFIVGLGLGAIELGPNAIIVSLYHERKGLYLNLMAVLHGFGSMVAPLFAGWLFGLNLSWRGIYRWDLVLIALFILFTMTLRFPRSGETNRLDFRQIPLVAFKGNLPWFYAAIALYVSVEIGIASWMVTFLQQARDISIESSSFALSLFFALLMIGRLIGGFFVHRVGYLRAILFASFGVSVSIALGLLIPSTSQISLPVTGLFLSFIFPTITAAVSDFQTKNVNTILGVLFTFAGLGGVLGPWLVAWGSDMFGLQAGFTVNLLLSLILSIVVFILMRGAIDGKNS